MSGGEKMFAGARVLGGIWAAGLSSWAQLSEEGRFRRFAGGGDVFEDAHQRSVALTLPFMHSHGACTPPGVCRGRRPV